MAVKMTVTWKDVGLRERLTVLNCKEVTGAPDTLADLQLLSNATVTTQHTGQVVATGAPLASSATFPDLDDEWIITGESAAGYRTQLYIPSPLQAAAIADGINYDAATSQWIALEAALAALAVPYDGADIQQIDVATIARDAGQSYQTWLNVTNAVSWARRTLQWSGIHGRTRLTHLIGLTDSLGADFDTVMAAFQAVSAAVVTHFWEGEMSVTNDPPTTELYNSVRDTAVFLFVDSDGNQTEVFLPAPNRVIFMADGKTVDLTQANVLTFLLHASEELVIPISGLSPVDCIGGQLSKQPVS